MNVLKVKHVRQLETVMEFVNLYATKTAYAKYLDQIRDVSLQVMAMVYVNQDATQPMNVMVDIAWLLEMDMERAYLNAIKILNAVHTKNVSLLVKVMVYVNQDVNQIQNAPKEDLAKQQEKVMEYAYE